MANTLAPAKSEPKRNFIPCRPLPSALLQIIFDELTPEEAAESHQAAVESVFERLTDPERHRGVVNVDGEAVGAIKGRRECTAGA